MENNSIQKLKWPGFLLIGTSLANAFVWVRLLELAWNAMSHQPQFSDQAPWIQYLFFGLFSAKDILHHPNPNGMMIFINVGLTLSLISFYGIAHMMGGKRYFLSRISICFLSIPIVSPLFIIGLPVGIWSWKLMNLESIRKTFKQ